MIHRRLAIAALLLAGTAHAQSGETITSGRQRITLSESGAGKQVPEEYIVEQGDTLWDICDLFFEQPWMWPTIWALNPHVTNPHWIYPGDVLRLRMPNQQEALPGMPLKPLGYTAGAADASQVSLNEGFITEKDMDRSGTIRWSKLPRQYLASEDEVYVDFDQLDKVRIGDQFSVYKVLNDVIHPKTGEVLGKKIQMLGILEIKRVDEHVATARIVRAFNEIERGAHVTPLMDHYHVVSPRQNLIDLTGTVVDAFRELKYMGQFHLIFIDKGAKDGVQVGNRFFVVRHGDGLLQLDDEHTDKLPWEQIGEVMVVETHDRNSTALITRSAEEIVVGDRVEMQRHY
jgi:hypothetical protein